MAESTTEGCSDSGDVLPSFGAVRPRYYLGADASGCDSSCPPEYADLSSRELIAQVDAVRQQRAIAAGETLAAGFRPRTPATSPETLPPATSSEPSPPATPCQPHRPATASQCGSGFESGGVLDVCAPSGTLAGLTDAASRDGRLSDLDDDELIGVVRAWHRLESWCASGGLAAIAELARRRPADRVAPGPPGGFPEQLSEFIGDEVAAALTLTGRAADTCLGVALDLEIRLPGTARALHEGIIDRHKARLIAEATRILTDEHAGQVEARILPAAGKQTTGQLRVAVARAILAVDPDAAARRREEAQQDPRVRRWQEDAGTAALAGYGLPPAEVLAADQRITARAHALRDAGLPGTLDQLRARAYLDALLGQDSTPLTEPDQPAPSSVTPTPPGASDPACSSPASSGPALPGLASSDPASSSPASSGPASSPGPSALVNQRLAARVNLTVPLLTHLGLAAEPGQVAGFGPVDPSLARDLADRAAAHPASRFCLTITGGDGRPIGHGCVPGRPPDLSRAGPPGFTVTISPLAHGDCDHRHQEAGYQPSRSLQHLIWARTPACAAPGCRNPAARCDLDHTKPYDRGGRTCECNLAPLCRHHHRCKQSEGWQLDQPAPGVMRWITPAGRHYITAPPAGP
jgi:uncharacterized protein DUF222